MSLDPTQMAQTADDLRENLERAALTREELSSWLGLSDADLDAVLAMNGEAAPETVWLVRDAVEATLQEEGDAGHWSVLTDENRARAQQWYALRPVPAR